MALLPFITGPLLTKVMITSSITVHYLLGDDAGDESESDHYFLDFLEK